jgi:hypothetical protein
MKQSYFAFFAIALSLLCTADLQAQLLKKIKQTASDESLQTNSSQSNATGKSSSGPLIGASEINDEFIVDEFGLNGIYYTQMNRGISKNKFQFEICKDKSTAKGAQNMPGCIFFNYEIPETNTTIWKNKVSNDGYAIPESLLRTKRLYFAGQGYGDMFLIEPGVIFMSPSNWKGVIESIEPQFKKEGFNLKDYINSGSFYVKNKDELNKWVYSPEVEEKVRTAMTELTESISSIYAEVEGRRNANNEMPSMGKLNTKFIQDRALKTYKEKYDPINKGWTHDYMYVHGNEWVNKKKYLPNGQLVESHRELQVVIVRKNPQGQCKADLMYYVEIFENGTYNAAQGKVTGPVSYVGMPGGYLPCEKAEAFKAKLAK